MLNVKKTKQTNKKTQRTKPTNKQKRDQLINTENTQIVARREGSVGYELRGANFQL